MKSLLCSRKSRHSSTLLTLATLALYVASAPAWCEVDSETPAEEDSGWYFFNGNSNNHPRLNTASSEIDANINQTLRLILPAFDDVTTFSDQRDDFMIMTPFIGVGKVLSPKWDAFFQTGYSAGKVRTEATDFSILLIPFHTDVELERSTFFASLGLIHFPCGMAERAKGRTIGKRFRQAKPYVGGTLNWNYLTFDARIKAGPVPLTNIIRFNQTRHWRPWSVGFLAGLDIPMTRRGVLSINAQYTAFIDYGDDFSGPTFNVFWKRFF